MSCARRLGCTALLFWKERMLRADNTTVIVLALQERGGPPVPMHRDEIVIDMSTGLDHISYPGTPYNTCEVSKVSAEALLYATFVVSLDSCIITDVFHQSWSLMRKVPN